jgi:hypothetical protein
MSNEFRSKRAIFWLGGLALLVFGVLIAAVVLPMTAPAPGEGAPDVRLPSMQNVPSDEAPRMKLDLEKKP